MMSFSLEGWRDSDGAVHRDRVEISGWVSDGELKVFQNGIELYSVVRVQGRVGEPDYLRGTHAVLEELVEVGAKDVELEALAEEYKAPFYLKSRIVGKLKLDREWGWFEGYKRTLTGKVSVLLNPEDWRKPESTLESAELIWKSLRDWDRKARSKAAEELLDIKNEVWLSEGEDELTQKHFIARMRLQSIHVEEGGLFEVNYDDGDLFWGHTIVVDGSLEEGMLDARFEG